MIGQVEASAGLKVAGVDLPSALGVVHNLTGLEGGDRSSRGEA